MTQKTQTEKFQKNWQKHYSKFGQTPWEWELDFLYYIEVLIPLEIGIQIIENSFEFLKDKNIEGGLPLSPEELHITIALPGRLGTHFQKNDARFIEKTCKHIFLDMESIPVKIQNFNVFENVLFAEIYDPTLKLQQLHETICTEIPFSQHPEYRYQNFLPHISLYYGGQINTPLEEDMNRFFPEIEFNLNHFIFGKANFKDEVLTKTVLQEFRT